MSAFVCDEKTINLLTQAACAALQMNRKYSASYPLNPETVDLLGKYADDLHMLYRALYIANIKAVNGRYGDNEKTLPKYKPLRAWDLERLPLDQLRTACGKFACYMYQICEDPIFESPVYNAFQDIRKLLCMIYTDKVVDWYGNGRD